MRRISVALVALSPFARIFSSRRCVKNFAFCAVHRYLVTDMFDVITGQLKVAGEKLAHLRRFL
jgi:hypothetical protein